MQGSHVDGKKKNNCRGRGFLEGESNTQRSKAGKTKLYGMSPNRRVTATCFNLTSLSTSVPSGVARLLVTSRLV